MFHLPLINGSIRPGMWPGGSGRDRSIPSGGRRITSGLCAQGLPLANFYSMAAPPPGRQAGDPKASLETHKGSPSLGALLHLFPIEA